MPIFDYVCETCGKQLEVLQQSFEPLETCGEECLADPPHGNGVLRRLVSAPTPMKPDAFKQPVDYKKAAQAGFTTYRNTGRGYDRIAGTGPDKLKR